MDINKILGQIGQMKNELEKMTNQSKEELARVLYTGRSGDDGIEVEVVVDGNKDIRSIKFSEGMKQYIVDDPDGFWDILSDLIITAFKKASEDLDDSDSGNGGGSMDDIMKTVENMTGIGDIGKLLGGVGGKKGKR